MSSDEASSSSAFRQQEVRLSPAASDLTRTGRALVIGTISVLFGLLFALVGFVGSVTLRSSNLSE